LNELTYPSFPWRAFVVPGAIALVLAAALIAWNRVDSSSSKPASRPDLAGCAVAARQFMSMYDYSVDKMAELGPTPVRACRALSGGQYGRVLVGIYRIEFGRQLSKVSSTGGAPPPRYRTLSAESELRAAEQP
jgi:hypothetical protein